MPIFFAMSLAGSIPFCIGLLVIIFRKEKTNFYYVNSLLKLSIILYLLPIQLIKKIIPVTRNLFTVANHYTYVLSLKNKFYLQLCNKVLVIPFWLFLLFLSITISISIFCIYEYRTYKKTCNILLKTSMPFESQKNLYLYRNSLLKTPCTIGFFKSYILFPDQNFSDYQKEMLFIHEQAHIQNKDSVFKFLIIICLCMHWYNPLLWIFLPIYSYSAECLCDFKVIQRFSSDIDRKNYAALLLDIASNESPLPKIWKNNFSTSKKIIKRRLLYIMKTTNKNKKVLLCTILSLLCLTILPITTYAYTPLEQTVSFSTTKNSKITEEISTIIDEIPSNYADPYYEIIDFSNSNECIILDDGTVLKSQETSRIICSHTFKNGYVYIHAKNKNGGCTITRYSAKICTKCNFKKNMVKISTTTYVKCTH
ncbi:MAG: M56 family metallopeptidase [Lactobacillus sp.]|nr:M56 family metallopeptidase [Lactobacillus sp.]